MAGERKPNGTDGTPRRTGGRIAIGADAQPAEPASDAPPASPPGPPASAEPVSPTLADTWPANSRATVYEPKPRPAPPPAEPEPPPREPTARERARASDYTPNYGQSARRPAEQRENAFQGLAWLLEGLTGAVEELRHSDLGLTEEFWVHAYAARRESLLAIRTVVDQLIEKAEAADRLESERKQRRERRGGIDISE